MKNKKNKIIIFGTAEIASMAKFYFNKEGMEVSAFTIDGKYISEDFKDKTPIVPFNEIEDRYNQSEFNMHVALSYSQQNKLREKKFFEAKKKGYFLQSYISSKSDINKSVNFGENCFVLENQTIQNDVKIGQNVVIWSSNHIGHGTSINDHTYLSSHVVISGHCKIGKRCFFGVNSSIGDFIDIEDDCFIGMSSSVSKKLNKGSVAINKSTEIYDENHRISKTLKKKYFFNK